MIPLWLLKHAKPLLMAGLVAVALMVLWWWNPLHLFGGKSKLQQTALLVSSVQSVGQLVTAQYYGEVIVTYEDVAGSGSFRQPEVALIARGWVKAGFDVSRLEAGQLRYQPETRTLYLYGLKPLVLDADINPWFIPQRGVPGFDIIHASRNAGFDEVKAVKMCAHQRLTEQALATDLLVHADLNGREVLKGFLGLLLGAPVERVVMD